MDNCEACGKPAGELYQRTTDRKFVCFPCLPAKQVSQYPGWREREAPADAPIPDLDLIAHDAVGNVRDALNKLEVELLAA